MNRIEPQEGYQTDFLASPADIVIGGAGAGVGKTFSLLLESVRHTANPQFGATFFRRTFPQITSEGGLWDEAANIYPLIGAKPNNSNYTWVFPSGAKIGFSHMQHEKNIYDWQGSQIPLILFDELTHFTKRQFMYMLSRNRSTCGVKPYIRATCNPDPDSFVAELIDWAIDEEGYIKPEANKKLRYLTMYEDAFIWGDSVGEVLEKAPHLGPLDYAKVKSFMFIEGDIQENKALLEKDPGYLANLEALPEEDKLRLLKKNWKVKTDGNTIVSYAMFQNLYSNKHIPPGRRYITSDIATEGNDCLIIWVFEGRRVIDLEIVDKNSGKEALGRIEALKNKYSVLASDISFDASGVGGGLTGFIPGAVEFKSIKSPIMNDGYRNLKSQCAFEFAFSVNQTNNKQPQDNYYIPEEIGDRTYPFDSPRLYKGKRIKWILEHQLKAFRRRRPDGDNKLELIPKEEMKAILNGISPDFLESLIQREVFDLAPTLPANPNWF
jgi:hypothetical protein